MRSGAKWASVAALTMIFGACIPLLTACEGGMMGQKYERSEFLALEDFDSIVVNTKTADVEIVVSDDGDGKVVCYDKPKMKHAVSIQDGTMRVELVDTRKWYDHISLSFSDSSKVTVYLPEKEYHSLSLKTRTGDITTDVALTVEEVTCSATTGDIVIGNATCGKMNVKTDTGDVVLKNLYVSERISMKTDTGDVKATAISCEGEVTCETDTGDVRFSDVNCDGLDGETDTGDIRLQKVVAFTKMDLETDTGDVEFDDCDSAEMYVKTDTGDVTGSLLTEKVFICKTKTGRINVPKTGTGGRCEITTHTGDIEIEIVLRTNCQ